MSWYRNKVERDLARWQTAGWVSEAGSAAIRADLASRKSAVRRGADLCHARRRAVRLCRDELRRGTLGGDVEAGAAGAAAGRHCGAATAPPPALFQRQLEAFAQAAVLGGIAVFGASIMLIAQMYHMEGNPPDAVLMWALGALLAAVLVQSRPALAATFVLLVVWSCYERGLSNGAHWSFLPVWAAAAAAAAWLGWRPGLHLAAISLVIWLVPLGYFVLDRHAHWIVAAVGVLAAVGAAAAGPEIDRRIAASAALFAYGLIVAFAGLYILQFLDRFVLFGSSRAGLDAAARAARHPDAGPAAGRHAVGVPHRQPRRAVARLRRVRARDLLALREDLRHAAQHLAVLPDRRRDGQRARLGRLQAASAQARRRRSPHDCPPPQDRCCRWRSWRWPRPPCSPTW